jgi:hypothetical protein
MQPSELRDEDPAMPATIPQQLLTGLSGKQARAVRRFWRGLDGAVQAELDLLYDERVESSGYLNKGAPGEGAGWQKLAVRTEGRLVTHEDSEPKDTFPNIDFYEYLVNHEIYLNDLVGTFHICSAHEQARAVLRAGFIPASFSCPFAKIDCPMRSLLGVAPGCSIALSLGVVDAE